MKLTVEDFMQFPDDGRTWYEIIDGELYSHLGETVRHQSVRGNLALIIGRYLRTNRIGEFFPVPLDVVLSRHDVVEPDLFFVRKERRSIITERNVQGVPDLVAEITSDLSRSRDEVEKRRLYEWAGVGEYWLIDPEIETIKVDRRIDTAFARVAVLTAENDDVLTSPVLPGLAIKLRDVFAGW